MCLPGTVEIVREQVEQTDGPRLDRRTAVLTGVGAAVAAAFPGLASGGRPATHRHKKRLQDLTHVFKEGFPVFTFSPPARETLITIPTGGFYSQEWTFGEHSGDPHGRPGPLRARRAALAGDHA